MKNTKNAGIFYDVQSLKEHFKAMSRVGPTTNMHINNNRLKNKNYNKIVMTSGGFDPLHIGHLECIQESAKIAGDNVFVVVVNGDSFLKEKKGYAFMTEEERSEII